VQTILVLVPKVSLFPLSYESKYTHKVGDLVIVPFRSKNITGIVWQIDCNNIDKKLKAVEENVLFPAAINDKTISLINRAAKYYLAELGTIAKLVLPVDINESPIKIHTQEINTNIDLAKLSDDQEKALQEIENTQKPIILKGVTGSGKTEVYFHAILNQLKDNKQALVMLPEIALSSQIISRFKEKFGFEPAIWNSSVTKAKKKRILRGVISGDVKIVIGARSASFLPYKNLGLIVVDEEHDASYKQNEGILYNARDMAVLRGSIEHCKVLLVSATPSIESLYNAQQRKYHIVYLTSRFNDAYLPKVKIIDMKQETLHRNSWLSDPVLSAIKENIKKNQQTLIFLNRRGYAPLMLCKACGYRVNCKSCSASMVMHKNSNRMECHHCGSTSRVHTKCPECDEKDGLILCGPGIERINEEIENKFPEAKSVIVSKDQASKPTEMQELLSSMENGEIEILIGTQIVTKGYHFPNLTLVIVVDADLGFMGGDLRASERTFQLLQQVGGRAGRADKSGVVMLQTYCPEHKVIEALANGKEDLFIKEELASRQEARMPPFSKMAAITITGKNSEKTLQIAKVFAANAPISDARIRPSRSNDAQISQQISL
jgi:primosomal protein N' (replication factor Y)